MPRIHDKAESAASGAQRLTRIPAAPSPHSSRAIVLGASVAGLLTAAVLTAHCAEVVVVDRDPLDSDDPTPRRGVPQGNQPHGLLVAGVQALEQLLPGFTDELLELGALRSDVLRDSVWVMRGAPLARFDSGLVGLLGTRLLLESHIRRRVRALAGVTLLGQHDILGLTATPDGARITSAAIAARDEGRLVTMEADLVVDATGRGSRAPRWLAELGYSAPPTQEVAIDIRYVSRFFQDVPGLLEGTDAVVVAAQPPKLAGGIALRQEGGTWLVMLSGRHGLQPPTELTEFAEFADTLPTPALVHVARTATPISAAETYRFPASRWRHYEQLHRRPDGFAAIGDAVCSFNPAYGQGISSAGRQALALARLLAPVTDWSALARVAASAADVLAKVVATPWALATGPDRRFPGMPAKPFAERIVDRYLDRLVAVAHQDPGVASALMSVLNLLQPPSALLTPAMAARVLRRRPQPVPGRRMECLGVASCNGPWTRVPAGRERRRRRGG